MSQPSLELFWHNVATGKKADFLVLPNRRMSYSDLGNAVRRWLAAFDRIGLDEGDRILVRSGNEQASVSVFIAALLDGLVPVLLPADAPDHRLATIAETTEAKLVVTDEGTAPDSLGTIARIELGVGATGTSRPLRRPDPLEGLDREEATRAPRLPTDPDGLAYVLFTSGTTSSPSGVKITRGNLFAQLATLTRLFEVNDKSRIFNDMALAHADGLIQGPVLALANRCAVIRTGEFQLNRLEAWLNRVRQERATHFVTVTTIWTMIDHYAEHDDYFDAPECRHLMSVASKLPEELWRRLESRFGMTISNQYGLTETVTSGLYAGPSNEMGPVGTIGRPIDIEARIDPASGADDEGELQLKGANVFPGYWRNAERTRESFTDDGWFRTGDIAKANPDGSYAILGRCKSALVSGGLLIRPEEIDEVMLRHPDIRDCVTVGLEDETFGDIAASVVVCPAKISEEELFTFARANLESRKVPKQILVVSSIPRGDSGKPRLGDVRKLFAKKITRPPANGSGNAEVEQLVIELAADIFRIDRSVLSSRTTPDDIDGWDSFSQINFVMAAEARFGITIPAARIAAIRSIGSMIEVVAGLRK